MNIEFVHCFDCRIPVTPSGRKFVVDGEAWPTRRDATPDMFGTTCRMMARINRERAKEAPRADAQD